MEEELMSEQEEVSYGNISNDEIDNESDNDNDISPVEQIVEELKRKD